jgi:hypothetical protein
MKNLLTMVYCYSTPETRSSNQTYVGEGDESIAIQGLESFEGIRSAPRFTISKVKYVELFRTARCTGVFGKTTHLACMEI